MVCNPEAKFPCLMHAYASEINGFCLNPPRIALSRASTQAWLDMDLSPGGYTAKCSPWCHGYPKIGWSSSSLFPWKYSSFYVNMVITIDITRHFQTAPWPMVSAWIAGALAVVRSLGEICKKARPDKTTAPCNQPKLCLQKWRLRIAATSEGLAQQQHRYCPATLPRWWNMMPLCQSAAARAAPALCRHCSKSQSQVSWEPKLEWNMFPA
jgi:hypothetical protein